MLSLAGRDRYFKFKYGPSPVHVGALRSLIETPHKIAFVHTPRRRKSSFRSRSPSGYRHSIRLSLSMRQLSLLVATTIGLFIMLSVFLMSRTSSLHEHPVLEDTQTTRAEAQKIDEMAKQASGTSLDLMESGIALTIPKNPVNP